MRGRNEVASSVKTTTQVFYPFCCPRLLCHQLVSSCGILGVTSTQSRDCLCQCMIHPDSRIMLNTIFILFVFFVYSRAIVKNQDLKPETPISNIWYDDFWGTPLRDSGSHKSYRPLVVLTFRLNYAIHKLNPRKCVWSPLLQ